jgi:hypothetical protein
MKGKTAMKNEMELMNMDERQRLAWFMANRGTLIAVGAVWLAMIGWELTHGRAPGFLLIMVPVFALLRAGLYFFYSSRPFVGSDSTQDPRFLRYGRILAALMLIGAMLFPLYSMEGLHGEPGRSTYVWDLVRDDAAALLPLALVYLWPWPVFGLARFKSRRLLQLLLQFAEPVLAAVSCVIVLWIPQLIFESRTLFFILTIPVNPQPEWGCYLAVAANGLYLLSWLAELLQPWAVQEG